MEKLIVTAVVMSVDTPYFSVVAGTIEGLKVLMLAAIILMLVLQQRRLSALERKVESMISK